MLNFVKTRPVGAQLFQAGRPKDGQTDIIATLRNFAKAPNKDSVSAALSTLSVLIENQCFNSVRKNQMFFRNIRNR